MMQARAKPAPHVIELVRWRFILDIPRILLADFATISFGRRVWRANIPLRAKPGIQPDAERPALPAEELILGRDSGAMKP
jgi:hypothetical protein